MQCKVVKYFNNIFKQMFSAKIGCSFKICYVKLISVFPMTAIDNVELSESVQASAPTDTPAKLSSSKNSSYDTKYFFKTIVWQMCY